MDTVYNVSAQPNQQSPWLLQLTTVWSPKTIVYKQQREQNNAFSVVMSEYGRFYGTLFVRYLWLAACSARTSHLVDGGADAKGPYKPCSKLRSEHIWLEARR